MQEFENDTVSMRHDEMISVYTGVKLPNGTTVNFIGIPADKLWRFWAPIYVQRLDDGTSAPLLGIIYRMRPGRYAIWIPKLATEKDVKIYRSFTSVAKETFNISRASNNEISVVKVWENNIPPTIYPESISKMIHYYNEEPYVAPVMEGNHYLTEKLYYRIEFEGKEGDVFLLEISWPYKPDEPYKLTFKSNFIERK